MTPQSDDALDPEMIHALQADWDQVERQVDPNKIEHVAALCATTIRRQRAADRRRIWYGRAVAAAVLLALGAVGGYVIRFAQEPPPTQTSDSLDPLDVSCQFELYRPGLPGDGLIGIAGVTPLIAREGDVMMLDIRLSRPAFPVVFARRPDGTWLRLLPLASPDNSEPVGSAIVRFPIDRGGEWFVAAVAVTDPTRYRDLVNDPNVSGTVDPFGTEQTLGYTDGQVNAVGDVRGAPLPKSAQVARDQFAQVCKRLAERSGGKVRAVALPVSRDQ